VKRAGPKGASAALFLAFVAGAGLLLAAACSPEAQEASEGEPGDAAPAPAVEVAFVTNRALKESRDAGPDFSNRLGELRGGRCRVQLGETEPDARFLSAESEPVTETLGSISTDGDAGVVLYIHGYYEDFERSCRRAAVLQAGLDIDARLLLFSWPANSTPLTYGGDVDDLKASVPDMQRVIRDLVDRMGRPRISIIAHSLGSRGLLWSLEQGSQTPLPENDRFRDLVLVAADVDRERFLAVLPSVRGQVDEFVVLVSEKDLPLRASQVVNRGARLGRATDLQVPDVEVIDVTDVDDTHLSGHIYHLRNDDVIAMIRRILQH
jgi:esterase/lipase superfamily enzyme